ncbi:MAG: 3-deoxy-manno-octulosonate cytidylyltransferase [Armatimonadetes bacterium]|nr:3-deoxy-manno-octulosonate cytidylyltransferase [Armatimonadota bacterium]
MKVIGVIPARYHSTRLPAKVLADIAGKPMVQHVYERASQAACLSEVIVATDDERVRRAVERFGGRAEMTSPYHASGTDRVAEVAARVDCDVVVNIQGDEPLIDPQVIEAAVAPLLADPHLRMCTVATPIRTLQEHLDESVVKVVLDRHGFALYFSRAPIPFFRLDSPSPWPQEERRQHPVSHIWPLKHIGMYVYTRETLTWFASLKPTPLEQTERLEQLRALENGCRIRVVTVDYSPVSVDTAEDLERVRRLLEGRG